MVLCLKIALYIRDRAASNSLDCCCSKGQDSYCFVNLEDYLLYSAMQLMQPLLKLMYTTATALNCLSQSMYIALCYSGLKCRHVQLQSKTPRLLCRGQSFDHFKQL